VQRLLAARLFNCPEETVLVGNGASELIRACLPLTPGKIGISVPTFDEYPEVIGSERLVELWPRRPDFGYSIEDLLDSCSAERLSALVLVNPDNPSGHFLPRAAVLRLATELDRRAVQLIVDESFVDFVDGSSTPGLLSGSEWRSLEHLIIVKSISKSYGIPGLRLGVMISANVGLIAAVQRALPIWNVNSVAEHFLQIAPRYEAAYREACTMVARERGRLFESISASPLLRPLGSSANFIACETSGGFSSRDLCVRLLDESWALLKDCSGKRGVGERPLIRLAVRSAADNDYLLAALDRLNACA
jgi:histidinol-phosphate/aromatic aminotransferase/cobyric acid decarboxylase-like protein